jgi:hypothetical protein
LCKRDIKIPLHRLPTNELNQDFSVVLVEQYLSAQHGPTKTALDRCCVLKRDMKKDVLLINTAEKLSAVGAVPFFCVDVGNYVSKLKDCSSVSWQGGGNTILPV